MTLRAAVPTPGLQARQEFVFLVFALAAVALSLLQASAASAEFQRYLIRENWLCNLGVEPDFVEDFSGFGVDTPFRDGSLPLDGFALEVVDPRGLSGEFNRIDTPPFETSDGNGTNHAAVLLGANSGDRVSVRFVLDAPLYAFGADFGADAGTSVAIFLHFEGGGQSLRAPVGEEGFYGFVSTGQPVTGISLLARPGVRLFSFALDNISGVFAPGPEGFPSCAGNVSNEQSDAPLQVLRVDGFEPVNLRPKAVGEPFSVELGTAGEGPSPARYAVWAWFGPPTGEFALNAGFTTLGFTVNPTPFQPFARPQPIRCLLGEGMPPELCTGSPVPGASPAFAPWEVTLPDGIQRPAMFTLQGILEDAGADNRFGFSVTNAVVIRIE